MAISVGKRAPWVGVWLLLFEACQVNLRVPSNTQIACSADLECPSQMRCSETTSKCVPNENNQAPTIRIEPIEDLATAASVSIALIVIDPESDPVTVDAQLLAGGQSTPIALAVEALESSAEGTRVVLSWDARARFADDSLRQGLRILLTPSDSYNIGANTESNAFRIGNGPPKIELFSAETTNAGVSLALRASDIGDDPVSVAALSFSASGDFSDAIAIAPDAAAFGGTTLLDLSTAGGGEQRTVVWRHDLVTAVSSPSCRFFVRVVDRFGASAEAQTPPFAIDDRPRIVTPTPAPFGKRFANQVPLEPELFDPNPGMVWARVEYAPIASANFAPAKDMMGVNQSAQVGANEQGVSAIFVWDLPSNQSDPGFPFTMEPVDTNGDEVFDSVLARGPTGQGAVTVAIRTTPIDSSGLEGESVTVLATVGDRAPVADIDSVPLVANGIVPITVSLRDEESDQVDVQIEYVRDDDTDVSNCPANWQSAVLTFPAVKRPSSPSGTTDVYLWDSRADATLENAFGRGVCFRARASDSATGVLVYGPWSAVRRLQELRNNNLPRIEQARVPTRERRRSSGALAVVYRLVDDDADPVDIRVQYSLDGQTYIDAIEYLHPRSEGRVRLASSQTMPSGDSGIEHVFYWDVSALSAESLSSVTLRLTAADAAHGPSPASVIFPLSDGVGPSTAANRTYYDPNPSGSVYPGYVQAIATQVILYEAIYADLTGDGRRDFAALTADPTQPLAVIRQNTSLGTHGGFDPVVRYTHAATSLAALRLDGDTMVDIATVGVVGTTSNVNHLINLGGGTLTIPGSPTLTLGGRTFDRVLAGDFNGDAMDDFALACEGDTTVADNHWIRVYQGDGSGGFTPSETDMNGALPPGAFVNRVRTAELDGDGRQDIVMTLFSNELVIWPSGPSGLVATPAIYATPTNPNDVFFGDVDEDGDSDLVIEHFAPTRVSIWINTAGAFTMHEMVTFPTATGPGVHASDVDGDGLVDLAVGSAYVAFARRSDSGAVSYAVSQMHDLQSGGSSDTLVALDDTNQDGTSDMVVVRLAVGNPTAFFVLPRRLGLRSVNPNHRVLADRQTYSGALGVIEAADVDADGQMDIIATRGNELIIHRARGVGGIPDTLLYPAEVLTQAGVVSSLAAGDIDHDGFVDLVLSREADDAVDVLRFSGFGTGGELTYSTQTLVTEDRPYQVILFDADVSADGDLDLAVTEQGTLRVGVWLNDGTGAFGARSDFNARPGAIPTGEPYAIESGDLNHDGRQDLVVGLRHNTGGDKHACVLVHASASNTFLAPVCHVVLPSVNNGRPNTVAIGDINQDGASDLVVSLDQGSGTVGLATLLGNINGSGVPTATFGSLTQGGSSTNRDVSLGDFDEDGVLDAFVSPVIGGVGIYPAALRRDRGTGAFEANAFGGPGGIGGLSSSFVDVDGDGYLDTVASDGSTNTDVGVYMTQYEGVRARRRVLSAPSTNRDPSVAAFGSGVRDPTEVDLFGRPEQEAFIVAHKDAARRDGFPSLFDEQARHLGPAQGLNLPAATSPISHAWRFDGDRRYEHRIEAGIDRWKRYARFGPLDANDADKKVRLGLSLTGPVLNQRGLLVDIPLLASLDFSTLNATKIRVVQRLERYREADQASFDPSFGQASGVGYLPILPGLFSVPRYVVTASFRLIPLAAGGNFQAQTDGPRFAYLPSQRMVRVLVEELGTFLVYRTP